MLAGNAQSLLEARDIAQDAAIGQYDRQCLLAPTKITVTRMMFPKHGISIR